MVAVRVRSAWVVMAGSLACTGRPPAEPVAREQPEPVVAPAPAPAPEPAPAPAVVVPVGVPVEIAVKDVWGRPLPGARVTVAPRGGERRSLALDERGVFTAQGPAQLFVEAKGFVALERPLEASGGLDELRLLPESVVTGRIVDARDGRPVAGVAVRERGSDNKVESDALGVFRLGGLVPGRRILEARGAGFGADTAIALGLAQQATLEIRVHPTAAIAGRVFHSEGGAPCTAGEVVLTVGAETSGGCPICGGVEDELTAAIGADGGFRFDVPRDLVYGVTVACAESIKGHPDPVVVGHEDVRGLRWEVERGGQIRGRVVDELGRPRRGIQLTLRSTDFADDLADNWDRDTISDAEGKFTLAGLEPKKYVLAADTYTPIDVYYSGKLEVELDDEDVEVEIEVEGAPWEDHDDEGGGEDADGPGTVRVRGVVRDRRGAPVADALIVSGWADRHEALAMLDRQWPRVVPAHSDERGAFELELAEEPVMIVAYGVGGAVGLGELRSREGEIAVRLEAPGSIRGQVRDRRGAPITHLGIDLELERPDPDYIHSPDGSFTIAGLFPGEYAVRVHTTQGDVRHRVRVQAGREARAPIFAPRAEIENLAVFLHDLETDAELAGCTVLASAPGGPRLPAAAGGEHVSVASGMAVLGRVPAGPVVLHVLPCSSGGKHYPAQSRRINLRADARLVHRIPLAGHTRPPAEPGGDLGYTLAARDPKLDPSLQPLRVAAVARGGPAERAGLRVGDVIVKVGAHEVSGRNDYLHAPLTRVAPGTALALTLADGRELVITAT